MTIPRQRYQNDNTKTTTPKQQHRSDNTKATTTPNNFQIKSNICQIKSNLAIFEFDQIKSNLAIFEFDQIKYEFEFDQIFDSNI
ncbi:hypothetical protein C2G38_2217115 [Gigaspora rosea]|uniref:Uncharacterized protein n=1 Tax=Gigaspora rosea TaxID=44941 RepID=A0A397UH11_9GLOM|nr:hypothetical protein C2G38_2217115 [Gigaspora rosea]